MEQSAAFCPLIELGDDASGFFQVAGARGAGTQTGPCFAGQGATAIIILYIFHAVLFPEGSTLAV